MTATAQRVVVAATASCNAKQMTCWLWHKRILHRMQNAHRVRDLQAAGSKAMDHGRELAQLRLNMVEEENMTLRQSS